jgi:hypothetical protein
VNGRHVLFTNVAEHFDWFYIGPALLQVKETLSAPSGPFAEARAFLLATQTTPASIEQNRGSYHNFQGAISERRPKLSFVKISDDLRRKFLQRSFFEAQKRKATPVRRGVYFLWLVLILFNWAVPPSRPCEANASPCGVRIGSCAVCPGDPPPV